MGSGSGARAAPRAKATWAPDIRMTQAASTLGVVGTF
jgi:hypothetical protein